jgi:VWFA-related protein
MNFMRPALWLISFAISLRLSGGATAWMLPAAGNLQDPQVEVRGFNLKVDVNLVTVDAIVRNRQGAAVTDLRAENFVVQDNGVEQKITHFSRDVLPLAVALVIDRSPSIQAYLEDLRNAALSALRGLKPDDLAVLFAFAQCPSRLSGLTADRIQISERISAIEIGSDTDIYAVVYEAARYLLAQAPESRRAVILISDNISNRFRLDENDALRKMLEASATLFSIRTPGENLPSVGDPDAIERIAKATGGEVMKLSRPDKLAPALDQAISNLRVGYTLGFTPEHAGEDESFHRLTVKLDTGRSCPGCRVQARTGYFSGTRRTGQGSGGQPYACEEVVADNSAKRILAIAAQARNDIDLLSFSARTETIEAAAGGPQIRVDLEIDSTSIVFSSSDGRLSGSLLICVLYTDARGRMLGQEWKTINLRGVTPKDFQHGIPVVMAIPLKDPKQVLKVIVYDVLSHKVGSRSLKMKRLPQ